MDTTTPDNYHDIIDLPRHVSSVRKPMPLAARAAQFAPFSALTTLNAAIEKTAKLVVARTEKRNRPSE